MRALFLVALLSARSAGAQTEPAGPGLDVVRERERTARLQLEAARSKKLYLMVDLGGSTVSLRLSGAVLASYALQSVDFGLPMTKGGSLDAGNELLDLYRCQSLAEEELREIKPGAAPPPADSAEAIKAPKPRVALACEPPLTVHLTSSAASSLRDRLRLPSDGAADRRVRVVLGESEAERLFASLSGELLVLFSRAPDESR